MELLSAFAIHEGAGADVAAKILDCVATEEAVRLLREAGKQQEVMDYAMERIMFYLNKRAGGKMQVECLMYANEFGELAKSEGVEEWFTLLAQEQEQQI